MSEAVFDFAAINRRMNRKQEPVAAVAALADCGAANRNGEIDPTHFADDAWRYSMTVLRASLDETETVFIGWDVECPSSS